MDSGLEKAAIGASLHAALRRISRGGAASRISLNRVLKNVRSAKSGSHGRVPKSLVAGISEKSKGKAYRGYRDLASQHGADSIVAFLPKLLMEKALGKKRFDSMAWHALHKPALHADTAVGNVLSKIPLAGRAFKVKEQIPWGKGLQKEVIRNSALGPLVKLRGISEPILVGVGLEKGLHKVKELAGRTHEGEMGNADQDLREKVASTMLRLHEENEGHKKRAHALRLLYKQAELGQVVLPQTLGELEEKLASLLTQDLVVFEKALELSGGAVKMGELGLSDPRSLNASQQFQATILGEFY